MNHLITGIALLVGIFIGVLVIAWLTVIPGEGITSEVIFYSATAVTSFCALGLTVWQINISREENRMTTAPYLSLSYTFTNKPYVFFDVKVHNNGHGPAIIRSHSILYDGTEVPGTGIEQIMELLNVLVPSGWESAAVSGLNDTMIIPSSGEIRVFEVRMPDNNHAYQRLKSFVELNGKKTKFIINYESIYREKYKLEDSLQG